MLLRFVWRMAAAVCRQPAVQHSTCTHFTITQYYNATIRHPSCVVCRSSASIRCTAPLVTVAGVVRRPMAMVDTEDAAGDRLYSKISLCSIVR